jgi:predicted alpha-1,6-mannanase (GH76 family)
LAARDGHPRWTDRAATLLNAISTTMAGPDGVIPGFDDGGDGGLFNGILARYLADTAVQQPELAPLAAKIVLTSAEAAWQGRTDVAGGPVFAPRWSRPAHEPGPGSPEADLSVQLSGWMLQEAAARAAGAPTTQQRHNPA